MAKVAIITGAATALLLAGEGYDICINYLSHHKRAAKVFADCSALGVPAFALVGGGLKGETCHN